MYSFIRCPDLPCPRSLAPGNAHEPSVVPPGTVLPAAWAVSADLSIIFGFKPSIGQDNYEALVDCFQLLRNEGH